MNNIIVSTIGGISLALSFGSPVYDATALAAKAPAKVEAPVKKAVEAPAPKIHVVAPGDSLSSIAEAEQLDSWRPLWNVNPAITDPNLIYADQQLVVPSGATTDRPLPEGANVQALDAAVSQAPVRHAAANYAAGSSGWAARVRQLESGGNYATNTGNGYYGAYQFSLGTWQGVGGSGLPSDASPAEQDMRAQMLYDRRGCSPWPNTCS